MERIRRSGRVKANVTSYGENNGESDENSEEEATQPHGPDKTDVQPASEATIESTNNNEYPGTLEKKNQNVPIAGPSGLKILLARDETRASADAEETAPDESGNFACPICDGKEKQRLDLEVHLRRHYQEYMFACCTCDHQFVSIDAAKEHLKKKECGGSAGTRTEEAVAKVSTSPIADASTETIKVVERKSTRSWALSREAKKNGDRKFSCPVCGHTGINDRTNLEVHLRRHFKEHIHACHFCERPFIASSERNVHERNACPKKAKGQSEYKETGSRELKSGSKQDRSCDQSGEQRKMETTEESVNDDVVMKETLGEVPEVIGVQDSVAAKPFDRKASQAYLTSMEEKPDPEAGNHFRCPECKKMTCRTRVELEMHLREHFNEFACSCSKCGKRFHKTTKLQRHFRNCKRTGTPVMMSSTIKGHVVRDTKRSPASYRNSSAVSNVKKSKSYCCQYCGKQFRHSSALTVHKRLHTRVKPYKCRECDACFTQTAHARRHMVVHHTLVASALKVGIENKSSMQAKLQDSGRKHFSSPRLRNRHRQRVHRLRTSTSKSVNVTTIKGACNTRFVQSKLDTRHVLNHDGLIGVPTSDLSDRKRQMKHPESETTTSPYTAKESQTETELVFRCQHCEDVFSNFEVFERHVLVVHVKPRPFHCNLCQRGFYSGANYDKHVKNRLCAENFRVVKSSEAALFVTEPTATGTLFECCYCSKQFFSKYTLTAHEQRHLNETPFQCPLCQNSYNAKSDLQFHMMKKHPDGCVEDGSLLKTIPSPFGKGGKSAGLGFEFPCNRCDKAFTEDALLAVHIQNVHFEQRPFHCGECQRGFFSEQAYLRHADNQLCRHRSETEFAAAFSMPPYEDGSAEEEHEEDESYIEDEEVKEDLKLRVKLSKIPWAFQIFNGPYCYECKECNTKFTKEIIAEAHRQWHRDTDACSAD